MASEGRRRIIRTPTKAAAPAKKAVAKKRAPSPKSRPPAAPKAKLNTEQVAAALTEYVTRKDAATVAEKAKKEAQATALDLMKKAHVTEQVPFSTADDEYIGTLVGGQSLQLDMPTLQAELENLGLWEQCQKQVFDPDSLKALIQLGDVDADIMDKCSTFVDRAEFIKITKR